MDRIDFLYDACVKLLDIYLNRRFNIKYEGLVNLSYLQRTNTILLPKHQNMIDIPLEGILLKKEDQRGYFLMKDSLPKALELVGGIVIKRAKEISKNRKKARRQLRKAKKQRDKAYQTIVHKLHNYNDTIVIHPEQTRHPQESGELIPRLLQKLVSLQDSFICSTTFLALDIEYSSFEKGADILLSLKPPIQTHSPEELRDYLRQSINLIE